MRRCYSLGPQGSHLVWVRAASALRFGPRGVGPPIRSLHLVTQGPLKVTAPRHLVVLGLHKFCAYALRACRGWAVA